MTIAAEQFGTNLRATVATTVPNFVRGLLVPMTLAFQGLRPSLGTRFAALAVGGFAVFLAWAALLSLKETFGRDLDFLERS